MIMGKHDRERVIFLWVSPPAPGLRLALLGGEDAA